MVNDNGLILHKTGHESVRKHDYSIYGKHPMTPSRVENHFDLGYNGVQNDFPDMGCVLPVKKKRKRKLSKTEGRKNKRLARKRFVVGHAISKARKFNIMGTRFRNRLKHYNNASDIVSGLVNFRMMRSKGMML